MGFAKSQLVAYDDCQRLWFYCPGCRFRHTYRINATNGVSWQWNGSLENPTLTPSLLNTWEYGHEHTKECCHLNITDGKIHYHLDCTHPLKGQIVELEPFQ